MTADDAALAEVMGANGDGMSRLVTAYERNREPLTVQYEGEYDAGRKPARLADEDAVRPLRASTPKTSSLQRRAEPGCHAEQSHPEPVEGRRVTKEAPLKRRGFFSFVYR